MAGAGMSTVDLSAVDLAALLLSGAVALVVPTLTEAITHSKAPTWLKSALAFALSAVIGAVTTVAVDDHATVLGYLAAILTAWLTSARAYVAGMVLAFAPNSGLGAPKPKHAQEIP